MDGETLGQTDEMKLVREIEPSMFRGIADITLLPDPWNWEQFQAFAWPL